MPKDRILERDPAAAQHGAYLTAMSRVPLMFAGCAKLICWGVSTPASFNRPRCSPVSPAWPGETAIDVERDPVGDEPPDGVPDRSLFGVSWSSGFSGLSTGADYRGWVGVGPGAIPMYARR